MARGVEERDDAARRLHVIGADVLRDAARFAGGDLRMADVVEERSLPVVDVAHDRDDGRTRFKRIVVLLGELVEIGFGIVGLRGNRPMPHFLDDDHRRFLVEHLVDRHHLAHAHERLDHLGRLHAHLAGKVRHRNRFGNLDFAHDRLLRRLLHGFGLTMTVLRTAAARGAEARRRAERLRRGRAKWLPESAA